MGAGSNIVQFGVLAGDIWDAGAGFLRVQVVMTYYQGFRIAPVQYLQQMQHRQFLLKRTRIGGLTADVEPALVADAYRVGVVVPAVGTDHPFRTAWLNLSVTTDDVVVADAEVEAPLTVPGVNLSGRACLVGPHCRTVDYDECDGSHNALQKPTEQLMVASAVAIDVAIIATHLQIEMNVVFLNIRQLFY